MIVAMFCISLNDVVIKALSGDYALHQIVMARAGIGVMFSLVVLQFEGGFGALRTRRPGLHAFRAGLIVVANLTFYAAIVVMPLATATALYFVAPLCVTILSIPVLGERVGPRRFAAVGAGFLGVLIMLWPEMSGMGVGWAAVLPMVSALCYAGTSVLTRKLGQASRASVLSIYIQMAFIASSLGFYLIAGDGKFVDPDSSPSMVFLLRAWVWPPVEDLWIMIGLGLLSATIGYSISQAYRLSPASSVAPFEYVMLIFAFFWGWSIFGEWPTEYVVWGSAVVVASGIYVFLRQGRLEAENAAA